MKLHRVSIDTKNYEEMKRALMLLTWQFNYYNERMQKRHADYIANLHLIGNWNLVRAYYKEQFSDFKVLLITVYSHDKIARTIHKINKFKKHDSLKVEP